MGWKQGCATSLRWGSFVNSYRDLVDSVLVVQDDAQFVPERDTGVLHRFLLSLDERFSAWRWPCSCSAKSDEALLWFMGKWFIIALFHNSGHKCSTDKSCWNNGSILDDLFDELFVVSCYDCLSVGCLWLVVLIGFVMLFVASFCSGLWGYCFRVMLFHRFRRSIFQQDKSCGTVGVLFWLGYVVSFSDCLRIGCFWSVVMKCLMFAGVGVCMLGGVRFGVQGLEDGQAPFQL